MTDIAHLFDNDRPPWPHQLNGTQGVISSIEKGESCCMTSPTGAGKSLVMIALLRWCHETGRKAILYSNRKLILDQTMRVMDEHKIHFGVIASSHFKKKATLRNIQLAMTQTVNARKESDGIFPADVVIVDEAHLQARGVFCDLMLEHQAQNNATLVGVTATPLGIAHLYPKLIIAGKNSECRKCGALVKAYMFSPWELDCSKIKRTKTGEFNYEDLKREVFKPKFMQAIVANVHDSWKQYNPDARPALGFAPGVAESKWFVDEFTKLGVRTAHIDGEDVYVDGEAHTSAPHLRDEIMAECRDGAIKIIWNRFVLREGVDAPWLYHLILATPIGSLVSFIQTVGRVLRYSPTTPDHVIIQDHGGCYWRHKYSPNQDIDWQNYYFASDPSVPNRLHMRDLREGKAEEPITCPYCHTVRMSGRSCPPAPLGCGRRTTGRQRMVLQRNGELKEIKGAAVPYRFTQEKDDTWKRWKGIYYRFTKQGKSFAQAEAWFYWELKKKGKCAYWPPRDLPFMPRFSEDWLRKMNRTPMDELISVEEHVAMRKAAGKQPVKGLEYEEYPTED